MQIVQYKIRCEHCKCINRTPSDMLKKINQIVVSLYLICLFTFNQSFNHPLALTNFRTLLERSYRVKSIAHRPFERQFTASLSEISIVDQRLVLRQVTSSIVDVSSPVAPRTVSQRHMRAPADGRHVSDYHNIIYWPYFDERNVALFPAARCSSDNSSPALDALHESQDE